MRQRARVDANQKVIVAAFRKLGATVQHCHQIPGCLDLIVGYGGIDVRVEIKDGSKPPSAQKLTKKEKETFQHWKGRPPVVITSEEDVRQLIINLQAG